MNLVRDVVAIELVAGQRLVVCLAESKKMLDDGSYDYDGGQDGFMLALPLGMARSLYEALGFALADAVDGLHGPLPKDADFRTVIQ